MPDHTNRPIDRQAATVTAADMDGFCPVQWYGYHRGWLVYFRARSGWSLRAWAPHEFKCTGDPLRDIKDRPGIGDFDAHVVVENGVVLATGQRVTMPKEAEGYAGNWDHETAAAVCNAALAHVGGEP